MMNVNVNQDGASQGYSTTDRSFHQTKDWLGELNVSSPRVVSYDDPAALRENADNIRPIQPQQMTGGMGAGTITANAPQMLSPLPVTSPSMAQSSVNMSHNLSDSMIGYPATSEEAYLGSLKAALSRNVGNYIVATFLVGTQNMVSWEGTLYSVGNDYLAIYQDNWDRYIVSDFYSLKFIELYDNKHRMICQQAPAPQDHAAVDSQSAQLRQ